MIEVNKTRGTHMRHHTLKEASIKVEGSLLFNSLPKSLRNVTCSQEKFKTYLDQFLEIVPDQPISSYYISEAVDSNCRSTNSIKQ